MMKRYSILQAPKILTHCYGWVGIGLATGVCCLIKVKLFGLGIELLT